MECMFFYISCDFLCYNTKKGGNHMPIGVITNVSGVCIGTLLGAMIKNIIPAYLKDELPKVFGICSVSIGIMSIINVATMPMVIMAIILGFVIGELLQIHKYISLAFSKVLQHLPFKVEGNHDEYMETYLLVVLMFSMSGLGLFGALTEGMSGDASILLSKSVLDFFTAVLFGAILGYAQVLICIPQFVILFLCFLLARAIIPYTNATMIADFKACGGIITVVTGLSVARILKVRAINLVPALILVMPLVAFYTLIL